MAKSFPSSGALRHARAHCAAHPVAAGFRPAAAALAVAIAFTVHGAPAWAQPVPQAVIHGGAKFTQNGSNLLVNTTNGANTSHSAINWTSFSVPAGSVTQFVQPSATSTSINRVVAPNPSEIFGRLASNGRLVLVNPWGIAVGQGAQVDTAGFTASTLAMSEADAIAGRLRFAGGSSLLKVDGTIRAQGGDVVLIAPKVETGAAAVVEADGAAVLAAGQQVEITGRGLEGIHMKVQAGTEAVNLGSLKADAVGMFAGTLKHSGLVQAHAVSAEGGKVVLKAAGDALVDGAVSARSGERGGAVDVLGERVGLLAGATVDASGAAGGGSVRIGGDYQGANAQVPNAKRTYVDAQARINADATQSGDGGRVIVWSDEATRMRGSISARGGAQGGDGGFAEASGKQYLEFTGSADLRAPRGRTGTLLLDPNDIEIVAAPGTTTTSNGTDGIFQGGPSTATILDTQLSTQLVSSDVVVTTNTGTDAPNGGRITLTSGATVAWATPNALTLNANNGIELQGTVNASATGARLHLYSQSGDILQQASSTVTVDNLLVQTFGNVLMESAPLTAGRNRVNTLAGYAGTGMTFAFTNDQSFTVGTVAASPGWSTSSGVNGYGAGPTRIGTTTGSLTVRQQVAGHGIRLQAADDLNIQNTYVQSSGPSTDPTATVGLYAGRDVLIGAEAQGTYSSSNIHGSAGTTIEAGRHFRAGAVNSNVDINGYGSGVRIRANSGDAEFAANTWISPYGADIDIWANGSILGSGNFRSFGYSAGTVVLTANTGSLSFGEINSNGSYSAPRAGNVTLTAPGHITGNAIYANGSYTDPYYTSDPNEASGGEVRVTSTAGNISINSIEARGGYGSSLGGGPGGKILLSALGTAPGAGGIFIGSRLDASGGDSGYAYAQGFSGGAGGLIDVAAHKGIQVGQSNVPDGDGGFYTVSGQLQAYGGQASNGSLGSAPGGQGGQIFLSSLAGNILLVGESSVDVHGGNGQVGPLGEPSGTGGLIDLQAVQGSFTGSRLDARGGQGYNGSIGGDGGSINVVAGLDLTLASATSFQSASAEGGGSDVFMMGTGGAGGVLSLRSTGGSLLAGGMSITSRGGSGYMGGPGGVILLEAANGIQAAMVDASGSPSSGNDSMPGGTGGDGGFIDVILGGALNVPMLHARGGNGGPVGSSTPGGDGGMGGSVSVSFTGPSGVLDLVDSIDASGGQGGSVPGWMTSAPAGTPGFGGNGGAVAIGGAGDLRVGAADFSMQLVARGGNGGTGLTGSAPAGLPGAIEISAGNVLLDSLYVQGNAFVGATSGITTLAGSQQLMTAGDGAVFEAGTGIGLASQLQVHGGTTGFGVLSLHTASGDIAQFAPTMTTGSIFAGSLLARADAGSVDLTLPNSVSRVGGSAAGGFALANGAGFLEVGTVGTFADTASGILAGTGVNIRSRGDLQVSAGITSTSGDVLLRSGDLSVGPGSFGPSGGSAGGSMRIFAPVHAGGSMTLEANAMSGGPAVEIASGNVFGGTAPGAIPLVGSGSLQAGGALVVRGTAAGGPGVEIEGENGATTSLKAGGTLEVTGRSTGSDGTGVMLFGNVQIDAGAGATVTGDQLASTGFSPGVLVGELDCTTASCKLTGTGALRLVGTSAGPSPGVLVERSTIDRTGPLELLGEAPLGAQGVRVVSSIVRSGGGNALFVSPQTVHFEASTVETGGGVLSVTGGSTTHDGPGVLVIGGSSLHAGSGALSIMGVSELSPGFVLSGVSGGLTASGADLDIVGTTVQNGEALVIDNETVSSTNSMRLRAEGGALVVRNGSTVTNTGPGLLVMNSTAGPSGPSLVNIEAGNTVTASGGGDIHILADNVMIDGTVNSGSGRTLIRPLDTTRRILINGVDDSLGLNFTQAELDRITSSTVVIGDIGLSGGISIEAPTTIGGGRSLSLINAGPIKQQSGATLTVTSLNADGASVLLDDLLLGGTAGGILSGRAHAGDFRVVNANTANTNLQIGTVDGISGVGATGTVTIGTYGTLQLSQPVKSDATGTAIALAAADFKRDGAGALAAPNGRWLVWLPQPTANLVGAPASGNLALWDRPLASTLPADVTETGNRYVFAARPVVHVAADNVSRGYDGTTNFGPFGFSVSGLVNAAAFGDVFLQDALTGALEAPGATRHVGSYAITTDKLVEPAGYARGTFQPGTLTITPADLTVNALPDKRQYDGTDASAALPPEVTLFGTDVGRFTQRFDNRNVGTGKTLTPTGVVEDGNGGRNYLVTFVPVQAGEITPAPLRVTAVTDTKVYDGTDASAGVPVLGGTLFGSDAAGFSQRFADRNAGTGKTLAPQGSVSDGNGGRNYLVSLVPVDTGVITPRPLTIAADNLSKTEGRELVFAGTEFTPKTTGVGAEAVTTVSLASEGAPAGAKSGAYPIVPSNAVGANGFLAGNYAITYLNGALAVLTAGGEPAVVQVNNQIVTFATLFVEQARTQPSIQPDEDWKKDKEDRAKDDIVVTDTACKP